MEAPLEEVTTHDAATDEGSTSHVKCKRCNRQFASISVEGGLVPFALHDLSCASCEPFLGLYDNLQAKEMAYTALLDRGPKHHGRAKAQEEFRNARLVLGNFLLDVEAPTAARFELPRAGLASCEEHAQHERPNDRGVTHTHGDYQQDFDGASSPTGHSLAIVSSPTSKRKLTRNSDVANIERKRIKFEESVEERAQYRNLSQFHRGDKNYIPGRYVPAEGSEFLDTSGSSVTFAKFTGQKKMGSNFVDITPKAKEQADEIGSSAAHDEVTEQVAETQNETDELQIQLGQAESQANGRETRSLRRYRSATPPAITGSGTNDSRRCGSGDDTLKKSTKRSPLVVVSKPSSVAAANVHTEEELPIPSTAQTEAHQGSPIAKNPDEATNEFSEVASIKVILANIERELRHLQEATVSPGYKDRVETAVRGFADILQPLATLGTSGPGPFVEAEQDQDEETIFFEALETTDHTSLRYVVKPTEPTESLDAGVNALTGVQMATDNGELQRSGVGLKSASDVAGDILEDSLDLEASGATGANTGAGAHPPLSPVNVNMQAKEGSALCGSQPYTAHIIGRTVDGFSTGPPRDMSGLDTEYIDRSPLQTSIDAPASASRQLPEASFNNSNTEQTEGPCRDLCIGTRVESQEGPILEQSNCMEITHKPGTRTVGSSPTFSEPLPTASAFDATGAASMSSYKNGMAQQTPLEALPMPPPHASHAWQVEQRSTCAEQKRGCSPDSKPQGY